MGGDWGRSWGSRCDPTSSPAEGAAARRRASSPRSPIQPHPGPASPRLRRPRAPPGRDLPAEPPPLEGSSRERSAVPPPPPPRRGPRRLEVGGLRPRPVPHSPAFCSLCPGVGGTPGPGLLRRDHRSPMARFTTAPSPKARGDGGSSHPPTTPTRDPQQRQRTPPRVPRPAQPSRSAPRQWGLPPSQRNGELRRDPRPVGLQGGDGFTTAVGRSRPGRDQRSWSGSVSTHRSSARTKLRARLLTRPGTQREALSPGAAGTGGSPPHPRSAGRGSRQLSDCRMGPQRERILPLCPGCKTPIEAADGATTRS